MIQKLTTYFDEIVEKEVGKAVRKFKGKEKELKTLTQKIKAGLLHAPITKLKESAKMGSIERYLETIYSLFQLDRRKSVEPESKTDLISEKTVENEIPH